MPKPLARYCPNCDERLRFEEDAFVCAHCRMWWDARDAYALPTAPLGDEARRAAWRQARAAAGLP